MEDTLKRRFFYDQAFAIYGGEGLWLTVVGQLFYEEATMAGQENGVNAVFNSGVLGAIPSVIPSVHSLIYGQHLVMAHFHRRVRVSSLCKRVARVAFPPPKVSVIRTEPY